MKKIIFILFSIVFNITAFAQTRKVDSLHTLLLKAREDTAKVNLLSALAKAYHDNNPDTTIYLAQQGVTLAQKLKYPKGEADCISKIGDANFIRGDVPRALEMHLKALKIREAIEDKRGIISSYNSLSFLYSYQGDGKKGLSYAKMANEMLKENINDNELLSGTMLNIGIACTVLQQTDSAFEFINKSYAIAQKIDDKQRIGEALRALGNHYRSPDPMLALEYFRRAIINFEAIDNKRDVAWTSYFIGMIFKTAEKNDSAIYYIQRSMEISKSTNNPWGIASNSYLLGQLYEGKNDKEAIQYFKLSIKTRNRLTNSENGRRLQEVNMAETLRQQEIENEKRIAKQERNQNIQYALIALGLVSFFILFLLLSHSSITNPRIISFLGVLALLLVFEFLNLLLHPYLDKITNHEPVLMLGAMVCIASLLIPIHHKIQHWLTNKLVEKNKKIRLAAAKKTIQQLEGE